MGSVNQTISWYSVFLYLYSNPTPNSVRENTDDLFISEIFLFQIYPSVQGQIFGRSSISFDGCDRQSYNKLMAVICRFDRLFSPNSFITIFTFRLFQKKQKKGNVHQDMAHIRPKYDIFAYRPQSEYMISFLLSKD